MALIFTDGFDYYPTGSIPSKWTTNTGPTIAAVGRNGTNGLSVTSNNGAVDYVLKTFPSPRTNTFIFGFGYKPVTLPAANLDIFGIVDSSANTHMTLGLTSAGILGVYRSGISTLISNTSATLSTSVYYYIEFKGFISDTVGTIDVEVNGQSVLSLTGQDTRNAGNGDWQSFFLGNAFKSTEIKTHHYDDLYVCDSSGSINNDFLGPIRVVTLLPDGAGANTDFTPSAGSNFQNVDDTSTDGDTTYNSSQTPGDYDLYTFGAIGLTGAVRGIQTNLQIRSNGAGSETIRPKLRVNSTDYNGTTVGLGTSYTNSEEVFEVSPDTGIQWTVAEIDASEFGAELVS